MSGALFALVSRFGVVGIAATLTYLIASNLLIHLGILPTVASVLGYLAGMVVSFLGQSRFAFRLKKTRLPHLLRFCILSALGLILSYVIVLAAGSAGWPPLLATAVTAVVIASISFVLMKFWVFPV